MDKAVLKWFKSSSRQNLPIAEELIKEKALKFSRKPRQQHFKASTGGLVNWKRCELRFRVPLFSFKMWYMS